MADDAAAAASGAKKSESTMRIGLKQQGALLKSPSFLKNCQPIFESLQKAWAALPEGSAILELASGSGEHSVYITSRMPNIVIQPSDVEPESLPCVNYYAEQESLLGKSILSCKALDVSLPFAAWPVEEKAYDGALAINLIHIAPPAAVESMFHGLGRALKPGAMFAAYDTWTMQGEFIGPTNGDFDKMLRARGYGGVRSLEECDEWATAAGMRRVDIQYLPANNQMIYWQKE